MCYVDDDGAAVSRTLDGKEHVQPAHTYVLRYLRPAVAGERATSQYRQFTPAMVTAMEHMTEREKSAYHDRVQTAMIKQWIELDDDPDVDTEWDEDERKRVERLARKCMAEEATKCLNERS
jgi:S-adenosylmethionine synthetase